VVSGRSYPRIFHHLLGQQVFSTIQMGTDPSIQISEECLKSPEAASIESLESFE
jgi:hypothetical protein